MNERWVRWPGSTSFERPTSGTRLLWTWETCRCPQLAVVTFMDARLHPKKFLGLELGDAHVIRNAGGRVSKGAICSLSHLRAVTRDRGDRGHPPHGLRHVDFRQRLLDGEDKGRPRRGYHGPRLCPVLRSRIERARRCRDAPKLGPHPRQHLNLRRYLRRK